MDVQIVFSSSATVYGNPEYTPLDEKHRLQVPQRFAHTPFAVPNHTSAAGSTLDHTCLPLHPAYHHCDWRQALNPYGRSKLIIEDMLRDLFAAEKDWRIVLLRYFNPVGAHPSGGQLGLQPFSGTEAVGYCAAVQPRRHAMVETAVGDDLVQRLLCCLQAKSASTPWASPTT